MEQRGDSGKNGWGARCFVLEVRLTKREMANTGLLKKERKLLQL